MASRAMAAIILPYSSPSLPSWMAILINFGASYVQETSVGRVAEEVLFDIRRAMFSHLQRVSLSFMDKTEVGRLMSRLQGDVNSMQEFLETSVLSVGDITLLFGIVGVMLYLDFRLGLMTLAVLPILFVVRIYLAAAGPCCIHGRARNKFGYQRCLGRSHSWSAGGAEHGSPEHQLHALQ